MRQGQIANHLFCSRSPRCGPSYLTQEVFDCGLGAAIARTLPGKVKTGRLEVSFRPFGEAVLTNMSLAALELDQVTLSLAAHGTKSWHNFIFN